MVRRVFYSFHYALDAWRVSQVRNMGLIEGNQAATDNDWEEVKKGGDAAIKKWIDGQMKGRSCIVVLIGSQTANRKWINYEIIEGWNQKKGILGIYIHKLSDQYGISTSKGRNPFDCVSLEDGTKLSEIVPVYDPVGSDSKAVYNDIKNKIESLIDRAIKLRN